MTQITASTGRKTRAREAARQRECRPSPRAECERARTQPERVGSGTTGSVGYVAAVRDALEALQTATINTTRLLNADADLRTVHAGQLECFALSHQLEGAPPVGEDDSSIRRRIDLDVVHRSGRQGRFESDLRPAVAAIAAHPQPVVAPGVHQSRVTRVDRDDIEWHVRKRHIRWPDASPGRR